MQVHIVHLCVIQEWFNQPSAYVTFCRPQNRQTTA